MKGDKGSSAFTVNYATKLLPGCNITVNENSNVLVKDTLIMYPSYESYEYTYWNSQSEKNHYYPTGFESPYVLNNGTITLDTDASFGGTIHSFEGSTFDASKGSLEATSYYGKTYGWNDDWKSVFKDYTEWDTITESANG